MSSGAPDTGTNWLGWAQLGTNILGGLAGGVAGSRMSAQEIAERKREFDKAMALRSGQAAVGASNSLDQAPMRDRIMYKLQQIMGQTPSQFKPHDIFSGGGVAQQGGYDTGKLQTSDQAYTPGAGGVNTDILKKFLAAMGYPSGGGAPATGPPPPQRMPTRFPQGVTG